MAETRRRFTNRSNHRRFVDDPSTHDEDFLVAFKAQKRGQSLTKAQEKLLETEEVKVVEIETVSGPRRVFEDRVEEYEKAHERDLARGGEGVLTDEGDSE